MIFCNTNTLFCVEQIFIHSFKFPFCLEVVLHMLVKWQHFLFFICLDLGVPSFILILHNKKKKKNVSLLGGMASWDLSHGCVLASSPNRVLWISAEPMGSFGESIIFRFLVCAYGGPFSMPWAGLIGTGSHGPRSHFYCSYRIKTSYLPCRSIYDVRDASVSLLMFFFIIIINISIQMSLCIL